MRDVDTNVGSGVSNGRGSKTLPLGLEEFLHVIARTTGDAIVMIDASSTVLFANAAVERIFGYQPDELIGVSLNLLMPEYLRLLHLKAVERYVDTGVRHVDWDGLELPGLHRDGHEIVLEVSFGESRGERGYIFTGVIRDITERKTQEAGLRERDEALERLNERLLHETLHDSLTNLPNRVLIEDRLHQILRRRKEGLSRDAALLFLDFDRFKTVNDSLGHSVGDALLVAIAEVLKGVLRAEDTVGRFGGDEFVILLDHVDSPAHAVQLAERVGTAFDVPLVAGGHRIVTSTSIGIVPSMVGYEDADSVLRDADAAMYEAKAAGRGNYKLFGQGLRTDGTAIRKLDADLRNALKRTTPPDPEPAIELLYFDGCPSWTHAWAALGQALVDERIDVTVRVRDVGDMDLEALAGFAGSPTIRVDGADLFGYTGPAVMACRRYGDAPAQGWPSVEALRARLVVAMRAD